jgi:RHS repeat-associated protein
LELLQYLFGGYEFDTETGLYNAGARLYDPILRRFYGTDPKRQFASPFSYTGNNPTNMVDPNGEAAWWSMLIGTIAGIIVGVATGGAGAVLFGSGMAASMAVGAVAGTLGSIVGDGITAGISKEAFTGKRVLIDALSGFAGGFVGAGVGGAIGKGVMNEAMIGLKSSSFVTRLGTATSLVTGGATGATASSGIVSAMTDQSFFSKDTALNIAIGAVGGAGGAIMASGSHFGWFGNVMPVEIAPHEFGSIAMRDVTVDHLGGNHHYSFVTAAETNADYHALHATGSDIRSLPGGQLGDVIDVHGVGRYVFPQTNAGYMRPISAGNFAHYLTNNPQFVNNQGVPLKLLICFGALPGPGSVGQTLATELHRTTYASPWELDVTEIPKVKF